LEEGNNDNDLPTSSSLGFLLLITFMVIGLGISCVAMGLIFEYHCRQGRRQKHQAFIKAVDKAEKDIPLYVTDDPIRNQESLPDNCSDVGKIECNTQESLDHHGQFSMIHTSPNDGLYGAIYYENGHRRGIVFDLHFDKCRREDLPENNFGWILSGHVRQCARVTTHAKGTFQGNLTIQGRVACNGDAYWILTEQLESKGIWFPLFRGRQKEILVRASFDSSRPRKMIGGVWHAHGPKTVVYGRFSSMTFLRNLHRQQEDDNTVIMNDTDEWAADFDF
jgi:hypothetical protein